MRVKQTWRTLGTAKISEKAKREEWEVSCTMRLTREEPWRAEACFTKWSITWACFCSISIDPSLASFRKYETKQEFTVRKRQTSLSLSLSFRLKEEFGGEIFGSSFFICWHSNSFLYRVLNVTRVWVWIWVGYLNQNNFRLWLICWAFFFWARPFVVVF